MTLSRAQCEELIAAARQVQGKFPVGVEFFAGGVSAAVRSSGGNIYTGICLDLACGIGFCAEHAAVADMLKNRETEIHGVVAYSKRGIIPPCGRCRELMALVNPKNLDCQVILSETRIVPLRELLPEHWMAHPGKDIG